MSQHAMQIYESNSRDTKPSPEAAFTLVIKALLIQDRIFLNNVAGLNRNLKNVIFILLKKIKDNKDKANPS